MREPTLVLRGPGIPQIVAAQHGERRGDGGGVLHGPHRRHPGVLQPHVRCVRHRGLLPGAVGRASGLDLLQHLPGHHERHVDAQDRAGLLQGAPFGPENPEKQNGDPAGEWEIGLKSAFTNKLNVKRKRTRVDTLGREMFVNGPPTWPSISHDANL